MPTIFAQIESMEEYPFIAFQPERLDEKTILEKAEAFLALMKGRRTVRHFSEDPIPKGILDKIIETASTAPSGANKQPWTFCVVTDPKIKSEIRLAAEKEEHENYHQRMSEEWLRDLAPLGTDENKPFLEIAPALIVVFKRIYELDVEGKKHQNYYVQESVGIASGFLIAAIHNAGLVCLTHTPSPMNFLEKILNRPVNERAYLLIPVGFPAPDATVPDISKKPLSEVRIGY